MSKSHKRRDRSAPPKFRRLKPGQIWQLKRAPGHPVVTGEIDEVTKETFVIRWMDDGAIRVSPKALPLRFDRSDWKFVARVA